jgi:hypothetical protein
MTSDLFQALQDVTQRTFELRVLNDFIVIYMRNYTFPTGMEDLLNGWIPSVVIQILMLFVKLDFKLL